MNTQPIFDEVSQKVKELYPFAIDINIGSNNIATGVWFKKSSDSKTRTFIPLHDILRCELCNENVTFMDHTRCTNSTCPNCVF